MQLEKEVTIYKQMYRDTKARIKQIERSRNSCKEIVTRLQRQIVSLKVEVQKSTESNHVGDANSDAE